ncbi:chromosome partitioning protein [Kribbella turkmenica]|uniref:Chromosome partitioning protein n=1 Tax=Kribbella turkmenica TaxID=2530375 RepID=A0A4R4WVX5_9ACTN|nr:AAA family ATPase [Kribbella turkmenica]TDD21850.1 chromosome partitioning protein [Kribbella turkmenica]
MTDSHNSGQHKDREAAAAEVRRMWQPTPSWTQPDPNPVPARDPESPDETEEKPDALSQEYPGDSWSRPAQQSAPWAQPHNPPPASSWAQPAADTDSSWTQPEPVEYDESDQAHAGIHSGDDESTSAPAASATDSSTSGTGPGTSAPETSGTDAGEAPAAAGPADGGAPVFGGPSFHGSGHGSPAGGGAPAQGGQQLSPAAQHFFPQGIPGRHPAQQREVSYRTDELIQALPLPREAPAERGIRSALRLRPGSAERLERIARATAATAFRRPVTIVVANPKGGSGKTPTTLLLAGALGQARGGGVVAWDNNELRGNMHLRTHDTNSRSTVTDMLQAMPMLTQPDARLGDVAAYLRHQVAGQYDVLTSATTTYAQIEAKDFDQIHRLLSRFYKVLVIDTGNNEGSSNWREAMKAADALVIPIKWKSLSCAAAVQMLEELDNQGPEAQRLIRRAVIAVSNGPGDVNKEVEKQLRPYFESRAAAVVDIPTDQHIAAEGPLDHSALQPSTRRSALELAAKVSEQITIALNVPR